MTTAGFIPNFTAAATVNPYSIVVIGANPFTVQHPSGEVTDLVIGVTDGSVRNFESNVHAVAGELVSLQNSNFVQVTAEPGTEITVGQLLKPSVGDPGTVLPAEEGDRAFLLAVDSVDPNGGIIWAKWIGATTVIL